MTGNYRLFAVTKLILVVLGAGLVFPQEIAVTGSGGPARGAETITAVAPVDSGYSEYPVARAETVLTEDIRLHTPDEFNQQRQILNLARDEIQHQRDHILLAQTDIAQGRKSDRESWEAYQKAYALVLEEKWKEAANSLTEIERKYSGSAWADDARFWNIYSLEKSGSNPEDVVKMYEDFLAKYRGSSWASTARTNLITLGNRLAAAGKLEYADKVRSLTEHDQIDVSLSALIALQNMGEDSLPDIIRLYEKNPSPETRERIVTSFSVISTPKALDFLIKVAETDPTPRIRHQALNFLGSRIAKFQPSPVVLDEILSSYNSVLSSAPTAVTFKSRPSQLTEADKSKIMEAVKRIYKKDADENVRAQAIFLIGQTATTNDDLRLVETAAQSAPSYTVRTRALMGLRAAPDDKGLPGIIAVAKSNAEVNTRKTAIRYLGQSKDPRARQALVEIASGLK
jgi:HEAT repeat protein